MAIVNPNWIANSVPGERNAPEAHGHPASVWINVAQVLGIQPESAGNPKGQMKAGPILGLTAEGLSRLSGPQSSSK